MMRDNTGNSYLWIGLALSILLHVGIATGFILGRQGVPASSPSTQSLALQLSAFSVAATPNMKDTGRLKTAVSKPADSPINKTLQAEKQTKTTATAPLSDPQDISKETPDDLAKTTSNDEEISQEPQMEKRDNTIETPFGMADTPSPSMSSAQQPESVMSSSDTGMIVSLEAQYKSALRQAIEPYKYYPKQAWRMRREGTVIIGFLVGQAGDISNVHIIESSGTSAIDSAAINALQRMGRFRPIPIELSRQSWAMEIPLEYSIL